MAKTKLEVLETAKTVTEPKAYVKPLLKVWKGQDKLDDALSGLYSALDKQDYMGDNDYRLLTNVQLAQSLLETIEVLLRDDVAAEIKWAKQNG